MHNVHYFCTVKRKMVSFMWREKKNFTFSTEPSKEKKLKSSVGQPGK